MLASYLSRNLADTGLSHRSCAETLSQSPAVYEQVSVVAPRHVPVSLENPSSEKRYRRCQARCSRSPKRQSSRRDPRCHHGQNLPPPRRKHDKGSSSDIGERPMALGETLAVLSSRGDRFSRSQRPK